MRSVAPTPLLLGLALGLVPATAHGYEVTEDFEVWAQLQLWTTLYEQAEAAATGVQHPSGDAAADTTTGFALNRARVGTELTALDELLGLEVELALENGPELLDAYARLTPAPWLSFQFGQFKIPTTWENLTRDVELDFPDRSRISSAVGDYSLSRAYYSASQLAGNRSRQRDLGIGVGGVIELGPVPLRYRLMVGNGLGANLWIGTGDRLYGITNRAQFFYGGRLELEPVPGWLALGGHVTYNRHDDMTLGGSRLVVDLERTSGSSDLRVQVPPVGLRLAGMVAAGAILEDYYGDGRDDLRYWGGAGQLLWRVTTLIRGPGHARFPEGHELEAAFRYDNLTTEVDESGSPTRLHSWTFGANYLWDEYLKVQLDYTLRRTDDPAAPDPADDRLLLALQGVI
jgi:hypothetical protein